MSVRVYQGEASAVDLAHQPFAGQVLADGGDLCFLPRFPFQPARPYTVVAVGPAGREMVTVVCPAPAQPPPRANVVGIYPTAGVVPRNLLRLYVYFSHPMSEGYAARHVSLLRGGVEVSGGLLSLEPELWDRHRTRLTVLLDPARIKRGLRPHEQAGYALEAGCDVELRVDTGFLDAEGQPLVAPGMRRYAVGDDVRGLIQPAAWRVQSPAAASCEPLTVVFDRPLDHALLQRCLAVSNEAGDKVAGDAVVGGGESEWRFTPEQPWRAAAHVLSIGTVLEDVAGNSLCRVFDRELSRREHDPRDETVVALSFVPW